MVVGRHRGLKEGMETHRLRALLQTAVSPDEPFANGRDPSPRQRPKFSADGRAGKVDLLERALCLFAISSLLRVRTLKPRPLSPFPLTAVVADAGALSTLCQDEVVRPWLDT